MFYASKRISQSAGDSGKRTLVEKEEVSKLEGSKKKRHELSNSATKSLTKHNLKVSVKFD
jgi:hypothetical protein